MTKDYIQGYLDAFLNHEPTEHTFNAHDPSIELNYTEFGIVFEDEVPEWVPDDPYYGPGYWESPDVLGIVRIENCSTVTGEPVWRGVGPVIPWGSLPNDVKNLIDRETE